MHLFGAKISKLKSAGSRGNPEISQISQILATMKRAASSRLSGKSPMQTKKYAGNLINDDDSDDEDSQTVPQTQTKSKFLMRAGHGTSAQQGKLSPHMMDVRIHKCLYIGGMRYIGGAGSCKQAPLEAPLRSP